MTSEPAAPLMLYDGLCGFCDRTVRLVLRHDRRGTMQFAALQSEYAREILQRHPSLQSVDSLVVIEYGNGGEERVSVRSAAVLAIARYLGGIWRAAAALHVVPRPVRDWLYDLFARHRYRFFGRYDACPIPAPEVRSRFIG